MAANSRRIELKESEVTVIKLYLYSTIGGNYSEIAKQLGLEQHEVSDALEGRSLKALLRLRKLLDETKMLPTLFLVHLAAKIENLQQQIIKKNDLELQELRSMTEKMDLILKQQADAVRN